MEAFELSLKKLIDETEKKLNKAVNAEDYATALTTRAFLNALQMVDTMYQIAKRENRTP